MTKMRISTKAIRGMNHANSETTTAAPASAIETTGLVKPTVAAELINLVLAPIPLIHPAIPPPAIKATLHFKRSSILTMLLRLIIYQQKMQ
jgi:hypothetical protein